MPNQESNIKASQIIKTQCCGNMLDIPRCELVNQVADLEDQLKEALADNAGLNMRIEHQKKFLEKITEQNKQKEREFIIETVHGAANHLNAVMNKHPYCDHVGAVKNYANILINPALFLDEDL